MSDAPTPPAATPPDPDRAALPRVACLLRAVRKLVDYGTALLATLQQRSSAHRCAMAMFTFGTKDLALIIARITCGLQRAAALEERLNRTIARGTDLPLPAPRPSAAGPRAPRAAASKAPPPDRAALLAALPSAEQIARQVRTQSLSVVITDICRDLGLAPGMMEATIWDALSEAVLECGINLARLMKVDAAQVFEDDEDDPALANLHWPAPSAGVAIATSLASLLTQRTVRADVAMTGEISLRGVVMPVGGIKEKCVAAARAGIRTVILPARNRRDLEDIPESVRAKLEFVWAEKIEDVLARALEEAPAQRAAA